MTSEKSGFQFSRGTIPMCGHIILYFCILSYFLAAWIEILCFHFDFLTSIIFVICLKWLKTESTVAIHVYLKR